MFNDLERLKPLGWVLNQKFKVIIVLIMTSMVIAPLQIDFKCVKMIQTRDESTVLHGFQAFKNIDFKNSEI